MPSKLSGPATSRSSHSCSRSSPRDLVGTATGATEVEHLDIDAAGAAAAEADPETDPVLIRTTLQRFADLDPDEDGRSQSVSIAYLAEVSGSD